MNMCNALPEKHGDVTDANVACWLQKASKSHKVLEINAVKGTAEREVQSDVEMYLKKTLERRRSQEAVWQFMSQKNEDNALNKKMQAWDHHTVVARLQKRSSPKPQIYSDGRKKSWLVEVSDEGVWGKKPN